MNRIQKEIILEDLKKKMVLLVGPRQVGKTWLAKEISKEYKQPQYLNYDYFEDRKIIRTAKWLQQTDLLIFDEIHKMKDWKTFLKGVFDTRNENMHILVTGSARLDTFRQGGDSLAGRYFLHHLLPISYKESFADKKFTFERLLNRGGFPEPLLDDEPRNALRWREQYAESLIRYDILDFERIHNLRAIQLVFEMLRSRIGSPISYKSISEDIGISPNTVKRYVQILEALYIVFRVTPFSKNIARSLKKEPKIYFYDTGMINGDQGKIFENFTAVSLEKHLRFIQDEEGVKMKLHYLRTKEGKEVDFCMVRNGNAEMMIEAKLSDSNVSKNLIYFNRKFNINGLQIVKNLRKERIINDIQLRKAEDFFLGLKI